VGYHLSHIKGEVTSIILRSSFLIDSIDLRHFWYFMGTISLLRFPFGRQLIRKRAGENKNVFSRGVSQTENGKTLSYAVLAAQAFVNFLWNFFGVVFMSFEFI
jgi:hypothetical protein